MNITFYILKNPKPHALGNFLLTLESDIYVHCDNLAQANLISHSLWSHPERFIPNQVSDTATANIITIGYNKPLDCKHIINTSNQLIDLPHIEWVTNNLEAARSRYKDYKQRNYKLITQMLD